MQGESTPGWGDKTTDRLAYDGAGRMITKRYLAGGIDGATGAYNDSTAVVGHTTQFDRASNKLFERELQAESRSHLYQPVDGAGVPDNGYDSIDRLLQYQRGILSDGTGGTTAGGEVTTPISLPGTDTQRDYNLDGLGNWKDTVFTPVAGSQTTQNRDHNYLNQITRTIEGGSKDRFTYDQPYPRKVLGLEPVAYWRLGEKSGTTAADSGPHSLDGTYINSPTLNTPGGLAADADTCVNLNGSNEYVDCGSPNQIQNITEQLTVVAWVNYGFADFRPIVTKHESWAITSNSRKARANVIIGGASKSVSSTSNVGDSQWHLVCLTYDGSLVRLSVDGEYEGTPVSASGPIDITAESVEFGRFASPPTDHYQGEIDEVAIYDRALTAEEIGELYRLGVNTIGADAPGGNGNLTYDGDRIYAWDALNRLRLVQRASDRLQIAEYTYDALGRRIRKVVTNGGLPNDAALNGTTDFNYSSGDSQCCEERDEANSPTKQYIWGIYIDELIQMRTF